MPVMQNSNFNNNNNLGFNQLGNSNINCINNGNVSNYNQIMNNNQNNLFNPNQNPNVNLSQNGFNHNNYNIDSTDKSSVNGNRRGSLRRNNSIAVIGQSNFDEFSLNEPEKIKNDEIQQKHYNEFKVIRTNFF